MFKARGPDVIQDPVLLLFFYVSQGRGMNLCSPVLKVMYSCDSEGIYCRCIVLHCHPQDSPVSVVLAGGGLVGWLPRMYFEKVTFRGLLETRNQVKDRT